MRLLVNSKRKYAIAPEKLNVVFYGTDEFSLQSLKRLHDNFLLEDEASSFKVINCLDVISGQSSCVSKFAQKHLLPLDCWPVELYKKYDLGLVVSFGHMIPSQAINACRYGILNVHGSLLPRWRGASPIHHAILAGDKETGVTVMRIKPDKFDVGEIICKRTYPLTSESTTTVVHKDLSLCGADLLMQTLLNLQSLLLDAVPQSNKGVTKAPKPKREDGHLRWSEMSAVEVDRRIRALGGLIDIYTHWVDGTKLRLLESLSPERSEQLLQTDNLAKGYDRLDPGNMIYSKKNKLIFISCADRRPIAFKRLALKGRTKMNAMDFYNGFLYKILKDNNNLPVLLK